VSLLPPLPVAVGALFLGLLFLGMANGAVFQMVPQRFGDTIGLASGVVGAAGGIGGFFLPSMLGGFRDLTGGYATGFLIASSLGILCMLCLLRNRLKWEPRWLPVRVPLREGAQALIDSPRVRMEVVFGG